MPAPLVLTGTLGGRCNYECYLQIRKTGSERLRKLLKVQRCKEEPAELGFR